MKCIIEIKILENVAKSWAWEGKPVLFPNFVAKRSAVVVLEVEERPDRKSEAAHRTRLVELRPSTTGVEKKLPVSNFGAVRTTRRPL
jgi:hypothetical protein